MQRKILTFFQTFMCQSVCECRWSVSCRNKIESVEVIDHHSLRMTWERSFVQEEDKKCLICDDIQLGNGLFAHKPLPDNIYAFCSIFRVHIHIKTWLNPKTKLEHSVYTWNIALSGIKLSQQVHLNLIFWIQSSWRNQKDKR